jgi:signal transduction histidine kinase
MENGAATSLSRPKSFSHPHRSARADVGVGFYRGDPNKLFDPFYTTKSGGMGIGLSISRSIIERHHGRIWAEPNDDVGATFAFSVPCERRHPVDSVEGQLSSAGH